MRYSRHCQAGAEEFSTVVEIIREERADQKLVENTRQVLEENLARAMQ